MTIEIQKYKTSFKSVTILMISTLFIFIVAARNINDNTYIILSMVILSAVVLISIVKNEIDRKIMITDISNEIKSSMGDVDKDVIMFICNVIKDNVDNSDKEYIKGGYVIKISNGILVVSEI